jgi:hypothetical protein
MTYGVIGIELRIREPSAEGVAPLRGEAVDLSTGDEEEACRAGVSRTSLRNWELFILGVFVDCSRELRMEMMAGCFLKVPASRELFFSALCSARLASAAYR